MKFLILLALLGLARGDCPNFSDWREWSQCLWLQNSDGNLSPKPLRDGFKDACGFSFSGEIPTTELKKTFKWPDQCGHCAFKLRCKNRPLQDGCIPVSVETSQEQCAAGGGGDICTIDKTPLDNCHWGLASAYMSQCATVRPDLPEWKRLGFKKLSEDFPDMNCVKKTVDGEEKCKCCCHPYKPNRAGTECVAAPAEPECNDFGEWNEYSECLWHPLDQMFKKLKDHCAPPNYQEKKKDEAEYKKMMKDVLGDEVEIPERCGFCSFKIKCRKRDSGGKPGCFQLEADRVACDEDDCEGCSGVCRMPFLTPTDDYGKCDWNKKMMKLFSRIGEIRVKKMKSYWKKKGFIKLAKQMPLGSCKESGDGCACCCHPYEPNDEGTECVLKDICKLPSDHGVTINIDA